MSNYFYFSISHNDEASFAPGAMTTLDFNVANHPEVNEMFYGFRCHNGGYTIEGYVSVGDGVDDNVIHDLLPGFEVRRYAWFHEAFVMRARVTEISLFTKHGVAWDNDFVDLHYVWNAHNMNE